MRKKTKAGTPIVVVTMKVTSTTEHQLEKAKKVIFVEADGADLNKTRIRIIENGIVISDSVEEGEFWKLKRFMDIVG